MFENQFTWRSGNFPLAQLWSLANHLDDFPKLHLVCGLDEYLVLL